MRLAPLALIPFATAASAEAPRVVVDVAPVHSLVAQVMAGVGAPELLLDGSVSPHGWSMRPAQAALLESAGVVVWTGPGLTPALEDAVGTLAPDAASVELVAGEGHEDHEDHDHDHGEEEAGHDDHAEGEHDHHAHAADIHFWLDPIESAEKVAAIAAALAEADPTNAAAYAANAEAAAADLTALDREMAVALAPLRGMAWVTAHDAWAPLVVRYGLEEPAAIHVSATGDPGAARMAELREVAAGAACAVTEPQEPARLMETVLEGTEVVQVVADPLGADVPVGPGHHAATLRAVAAALAGCVE
ncbi:zinc ABC transporter substrate-binding protein [Jannaschia sp. Os4]|uniref:metal ABC transporter solute-binding protein, Zn/Mn family n=1 Tax=Jannaschia sp. Os4 TaxID=2807617 RepID=UPI001939455D|nr:zinc ABC transporter substrate-binding protein [Jannaschia sp. Os4]MBM2575885.1 zinc ABC transporter substrate-binding protein [Jannaschia sp. Os4]